MSVRPAIAPPARRARRMGPAARLALLLAPALLLLAGLFAVPLLRLFQMSFTGPAGGFSLEHYVHLATHPVYLKVLGTTFRIAAWVTGISLLLGYPVACFLAAMPARRRNLWLILVLLPFWTSFLVRSFAWIILLQHTGAINRLLLRLGLIDEPLRLMYNFGGVLVGMVHALMPYAILTMVSVMEGIDRHLVQAAQTLGASPFRAFWRVYFPLSLPGVAAGGLLVFLMALGFFITPALLGGPREVVIAQVIENQINLLLNWGFGAALAFVLFLMTVLIYVIYDRVVGLETMWGGVAGQRWAGAGRPARGTGAVLWSPLQRVLGAAGRLLDGFVYWVEGVGTGVAARTGRVPLGRAALWGVSLGVLAYLVLPILVVVPASVTGASYLEFPPRSFSLRWYATYFGDPQWVAATLRSLQVGLFTAVLATGIGAMAAFALVRGGFRGKTGANSFILAPMIIPRMVIAIAVFAVYARMNLVGTTTGLVLAHTVLALPTVVVALSAVLRGFDERLEHAALTLGAPPARVFRHVTLPIIRTGLLSAALFAFVISFDELILALFITGGMLQTLPRKMWDDIHLQVNPTLAAVSTILLVGVVVVLVTVELLRRKLEDVSFQR